jgi:hypothetical protein
MRDAAGNSSAKADKASNLKAFSTTQIFFSRSALEAFHLGRGQRFEKHRKSFRRSANRSGLPGSRWK